MSGPVAFMCAVAVAADVVASDALLRSGAWRRAQSMVVLATFDAVLTLAAMAWAKQFYTPGWGIVQDGVSGCLGALYALEIALGLPSRAQRMALRGLCAVAVGTAVYMLVAWPDAGSSPRTTYRLVALGEAGAAASLAVVLCAGLLHHVTFSPVTRRALGLFCGCYVLQVAAKAPFERWVLAGHNAQLLANGAYALAFLLMAQAAWRTVPAR